jgi:menaquinone-9 beta-reductase
MSSPSATYDALIVGARCAGAATAMLLARAGARVLAIDRGPPGADTLSTHALMRAGVLQLARWGLLDRVVASGAPPVRTATFHYGDDARTFAIQPRGGVDALYAPRRTVLDAILVAAAREAGAEVRHGTRLVELVRDRGGAVCGAVIGGAGGPPRTLRAKLVIGADGLRSAVARRVGPLPARATRHASALIYGYWPGLPADGYHWHWRPGVSVGVIPTHDDRTCVFVAAPAARFRDELRHDLAAGYRRLLAEGAPGLAGRLAAGAPDALRPFAGQPGYLRQARGPGWALVGDAGYFKDPLTAHGISDALRDAELLARSVLTGDLAGYQDARDELSRDLLAATDEVASFGWDLTTLPALHQRLSRAMAREVEHLAGLPALAAARAPARAAAPGGVAAAPRGW